MQDPPKGTHHKFVSTKLASASKLSEGKAIKHSVTGLSKLSPKATTPKKPKTSPPSYNEVMRECDVSTKQPPHVPVVPVLRSPPPVPCVTNTTPPTDMANGPNMLIEPSANITGAPVVSAAAAVQACSSLVKTVLSSWASTPKPPSRPGSALLVRCDCLPTTCPPSCVATSLVPSTSIRASAGPQMLMTLMSQPHWLDSVTASPDLFGSSKESSSPLEQTNQKLPSQVSDSSEIHGMTLKYSDDQVTDEEMRQLDLQAAAHQHMMEQDGQQPTTPLPFQQPQDPVQKQAWEEDRYILDGQNTRFSQVSQKQTAYLPDGIPGFRMQIPYLSQFFGTHWYLVQKDTYAMYAIYDALFSEIP